jgi:Zn-dependent protease with chaperone function
VATAAALPADWFDGRSSRPRPVQVHLVPGRGGPSLHLRPAGGGELLLQRGPGDVTWPERFSRRRPPARVLVDLGEHGSLELRDAAAWHDALAAAGARAGLAERMQTRWPVFLGVVLVAVAGAWAFWRFATPWTAAQLSARVPLAWELRLSAGALQDLDGGMLRPSRLPAVRQAALRARFDALAAGIDAPLRRYPGYAPALRLEFRRGLGANAFALPGGTIVVTDGLVELAARRGLPDEAVAGVLAHEIGHVLHRHTTRMVVEQGVLNVGMGLALGDVSWVFSSGATLLTGLAYRRGHEAEADCFAVRLLQRAQVPTAPMADLLLALGEEDDPATAQAPADGASPRSAGWATLLATHPDTPERAQRLRRGDAGC